VKLELQNLSKNAKLIMAVKKFNSALPKCLLAKLFSTKSRVALHKLLGAIIGQQYTPFIEF
jgi:hypothetical protein